MIQPRFLADNDLMDQIVVGVQRREPTIVIVRLREVGLTQASDPVVLEYAAREGFVLISHDINTMRAAAVQRMERGEQMGTASNYTIPPSQMKMANSG